jgi:RNA polymerase sigma factor (sigma-70 family)
MSNDENWRELVPRLEADIQERRTASSRSDTDAWVLAERMLRLHGKVLLRTYSSLGLDDLEDIIQTLLLKLQSAHIMRRVAISGSPAGYIAVMMRNAAIDLIRSRRHQVEYSTSLDDVPASRGIGSFPESEKIESASALQSALRHLTAEERYLLELRFWRDMSISETASHLGINYSATAVRLFRVLAKIREHLRLR